MTTKVPFVERVMRYVEITPNGCWEWVGYKNQSGYACVFIDGSKKSAHRLSYEAFVGEIPTGLSLDHLCRNRACINPAHLEPVTLKENSLRGVGICAKNAAKTHCKLGHELSHAVERGRHRRRCVICQYASIAKYQAKKKKMLLAIIGD